MTSLVPQTVKRLPTMQETQVRSLDWKDLLEKEMAPHSSILAWKIPWTEEPGGVQSIGLQRVRHDCAANTCTLGFPGSTSGKEPTRQRRRHKTQVRSLSQEDPLKKGMASHSSILVWRMPWTEEPGGLQSMGSQRVGHD